MNEYRKTGGIKRSDWSLSKKERLRWLFRKMSDGAALMMKQIKYYQANEAGGNIA
jgi:hypothetical protein